MRSQNRSRLPTKASAGHPSERYITLLHAGARAHGLPEPWCRYLDSGRSADDVLGG